MTRERLGRWLWLPAAVCAIGGVLGLADLHRLELTGVMIYVLPHLLGVGMTALGGYHHFGAALVGLGGSALMAGLSWWDKLDRQTEGFEWQFNNAFGSWWCCWANYVLFCPAT